MFKLSNDIYMLLVDAILDGETSHGFYIFKLNLTQLFKMSFYYDLSLQLLLDKALMRVYMIIFYVFIVYFWDVCNINECTFIIVEGL